MTKSELIEAIQDFPDDAEVVTQFDPITSPIMRWACTEVIYDKERDMIVIV